MSEIFAYTSPFMHAASIAPCVWALIGLLFMVTAPANWHDTLLKEECMRDVPLDQENIKPIFGMLTHATFFIGELNFGVASIHIMNLLGFHPALAATPFICLIGASIVKIKMGKGGPTGLPISGPPAPVPQLALSLTLVMILNVVYQSAAGVALKHAHSGPYDAVQFWVAFVVIVGLPNAISQYHLATSHWHGAPLTRSEP